MVIDRSILACWTLAAAVGGAFLLGAIAVESVADQSWTVRGGVSGVAFLVAGGASIWFLRPVSRQRENAKQALEAICQGNVADLRTGCAVENALPLDRDNPWYTTVARVHEVLIESGEQLVEAKQARAALEIRGRRKTDQYERIFSILSGVNEPIIAIDRYDEIILANPNAQRLFGFDLASSSTKALASLVSCEKMIDLLVETRRRRVQCSRSEEIELAIPDGESRCYRVTATSIMQNADGTDDASEAPSGVVAVLRDISNQKAAQRRNAEFVSAVSHEMKTPLAGIRAYVELLVDGDAEDEKTREEFLNVIHSQADRLQRLVDNMLNLARIEAGVVDVNKRSIPLNDLLQEAASVVHPSADAKQIELDVDLSPMYLGVLVDRDMLSQAVINLLSNAIKYTHVGGRVSLRSRMVGEEVRLEVEDTGVGLDPDDCKKVFEKFYRVTKDSAMAAGTGLGLPLAKYIVEDVHRGTLEVTSEPGVGSTFTVTLPGAGQMTSHDLSRAAV